MIRLDHVYKGFNGNAVLEDISLALPEKGFCAITGRSGRLRKNHAAAADVRAGQA